MFGFLKRLFRPHRRHRRLEVASLSARGLVRPDNQDHFLVHRGRGFFCVADGMGGGEGGAKASAIVCRRLARAVASRVAFAERIRRVAEAIPAANDEIRDFARAAGYRQMATTVATLTIDDASDATSAVVGHIGDSRVYRFRDGACERLTVDHTVAEELSRRGGVRCGVTTGTGGLGGALSHVLTRAVGIEADVRPDWRRIDVKGGDVYLLCSDGVYDMVSDDALREAIDAGGPVRETVGRIAAKVVAGGAVDNYTLVVVRVGGVR